MGRHSFHKFTLERVLCLFLSAAKFLEAKSNDHPLLRWISIGKNILTVAMCHSLNPDLLSYLKERNTERNTGICLEIICDLKKEVGLSQLDLNTFSYMEWI